MQNTEEIQHKPRSLISEISSLKKNLDELNTKKEIWFNKKEELKKEISSLTSKIKDIKLKNDQSNINIVEIKRERDKYNNNTKDLVNKLQRLNKEKIEIFKKYKVKEDPYKIQKKIEEIEKRLDTETSFENEKKLMKRLNDLKKIFKESRIKELIDNIDKISNELESTKTKANEFHNKLKDTLRGKNGYSEFIDLSRNINDLRAKQEEAFNKFIEYKKEFLKVNNLLKDKLKESNIINTKINENKKVQELSKKEQIKNLVKQKTQNVLEKFKKKKRLETQDLIVLQGED